MEGERVYSKRDKESGKWEEGEGGGRREERVTCHSRRRSEGGRTERLGSEDEGDRGDGRVHAHVKEKDCKVRESAVIAISRGVVLVWVCPSPDTTCSWWLLSHYHCSTLHFPSLSPSPPSLQEREIRRQRVAQQREVDNQRRAQERTMRLLAHLRQQEIDRDRR